MEHGPVLPWITSKGKCLELPLSDGLFLTTLFSQATCNGGCCNFKHIPFQTIFSNAYIVRMVLVIPYQVDSTYIIII